MAYGHKKLPEPDETRARERHGPRLKRSDFEASPEFEAFKAGMKKLLTVPKSKLDALVRKSKAESPRRGNPVAPGRKPNKPDG